ncbi:hypothetical protein [Bacillus sp. AFS017336]|uniref:hypothetical protein n=1 Tax=Bacillus sp. AFS017336 TaxID=2033489 RepID=UPI000BEF45C4|nr:hypothetical protein [Bacillus sp. AFS017336]PEK99518.1 hypothetical protein CN601_23920 [Bacillus sp. AFS017336]
MNRKIYILLKIVINDLSILVFSLISKLLGISEFIGVIIGIVVCAFILVRYFEKYDPDSN